MSIGNLRIAARASRADAASARLVVLILRDLAWTLPNNRVAIDNEHASNALRRSVEGFKYQSCGEYYSTGIKKLFDLVYVVGITGYFRGAGSGGR